MTCTVSAAWNAIASNVCRTSEPVKWPPIRWCSKPAGSPVCTRYGRPLMSTTACASASSSGTRASPYREMPALSPSASRIAWPEHDRDVLDRVVGVDVGVARRAHRQVGERVLRERGQQVVEERHGGVDVAASRAVEVEFEFDGRLARRAAQRRGAGGSGAGHEAESSEARASRNAVVSCSVPAVTRR